ncbi:DUF7537 family lipoprotein [Haloarcula laminariae]|uniref:DUF7537 family lipoprotein n=1 Tax=Haloarcula laminariae TaxID=2961577 RepID=UPI002406836C|nr:hypothetical protein [Halomicroarcula sp. FL173]
MTHRLLVLVVLSSVLVAGCAGFQGAETPTAETPTAETPAAETPTPSPTGPETSAFAGVSNETLTNASALIAANEAVIAEHGARISIDQAGSETKRESRLTVGADGTFERTMTATASSGQSGSSAYYSNGSATYVRMQSENGTSYRVVEQGGNTWASFSSSLETVLAAGTFTVATDSNDSETVVLTADEFHTEGTQGVLGDAMALDGRLVLDRNGQIQNLTVTGDENGEAVAYTYELRESSVERASAPAWIADVPPSASLHPDLSTTVENDSLLRIDHRGGDAVPQNATLSFSANNTAGTVTFDAALESGETRYAYFTASDGSLVLTSEQPASGEAVTVESPATVTISVGDSVTLHSVGMGWGSEMTSEPAEAEASQDTGS